MHDNYIMHLKITGREDAMGEVDARLFDGHNMAVLTVIFTGRFAARHAPAMDARAFKTSVQERGGNPIVWVKQRNAGMHTGNARSARPPIPTVDQRGYLIRPQHQRLRG